MLNFTDHARPVRRNTHSVLALLTLAAMTTAGLLPGEGTTTVVAAEADASRDHRGVPEGSTDTESRRTDGARTAETVGGKAEQRRAQEVEEPAAGGSGQQDAGEAPAGEPHAIRESGAALQIVGEKDRADRATNGQRRNQVVATGKKSVQKKVAGEEAAEKKADEEEAAPPPFPAGPSRLFARHDGMHLFTPSADPVRIGFHEAAYPVALGMIPLGRALANDNGGKYHLPPFTPTDQQYMVLSSRGRPNHATSAADVVMRPGEPVRSVVTGMVIEVEPYMLYGKYPDAKIRIRSAEDNGKVVTMLHVTGPRVNVGQQVLAGETIVANSATLFPFLSQIDYYLGDMPHPHVHVEVKRG